ncbi:hypothetical protein DLAC_07413 [Tieghemostelium lacteum]|uniref:Uncharacterized protein n=1 Tax=Tieghemostelium lacteum TaxID=361077 RepID=A0A151ZCH6_TIELA|nr:hypothetical protein DLAC_07413 [Tieghemostelium lacteum]|eukprot:KYQ91639.1 hypothetical protein DLAC_07413 [Tieghemostelium lacteum]
MNSNNNNNTQPTSFTEIDIPKEHWDSKSVLKWCKFIEIPEKDLLIFRDTELDGFSLVYFNKSGDLIKQLRDFGVSNSSSIRIFAKFNPPETQGMQADKRWTFVDPVNQGNYYHIDPKHLQLDILYSKAIEGGSWLVQGSYRSGKTTHMMALEKQIQKEFHPIILTLNPYIDIWKNISGVISIDFPDCGPIKDVQEFKDKFLANKKYFGGRKVVLLFDEFQCLLDTEEYFEFCSVMKYIMDNRAKYNMQAIFGFGTFRTIKLAKLDSRISSFHMPETTIIEPLPEKLVYKLLNEWANTIGMIIPPLILKEIYITIGGYAGLLGLVGLALQSSTSVTELKSSHNKNMTMNQWLFIREQTSSNLQNQPQFQKLAEIISGDEKISKLAEYILYRPEPFFCSPENIEYMMTLSDYGLLRQDSKKKEFYLSSPLVREFLLAKYYRNVGTVNFPDHWEENIIPFLKEIVRHLRSREFPLPETQNFTTKFTSEYTFQAEIFAIIKNGINGLYNSPYVISIEAKTSGMGHRRADILVRNGKRIIFELKSGLKWENADLAQQSVIQLDRYAEDFQVHTAIILNLVPNGSKFSHIEFIHNQVKYFIFEVIFDGNTFTLNTKENIEATLK